MLNLQKYVFSSSDSAVATLANGGHAYGLLELTYSSVTRTICNNGNTWETYDTIVACKNINSRFKSGGTLLTVTGTSYYYTGALDPYFKDVECRGDETQLIQCRTSGLNNFVGCTHDNDVGLWCTDETGIYV